MVEDVKTRIREAYLAHRLNHSELVRVARNPALLDELRDPASDERVAFSHEELREAWQSTGLQEQFDGLSSDRVWSPYERALYRRLATPDNDECVSVPAATPGRGQLVETSLASFDRWDRNADTLLTPTDLDWAMALPDLSAEEQSALALLRGRYVSLGGVYPGDGDGVSRRDLNQFAQMGSPGTAAILDDYELLLKRAATMCPAGAVEGELKEPLEMFQGKQGACVLLSTAAGLESSALEGMFRTEGEGAARVNFKDGDYEIVNDLTPAERLYHAHTADGGRWPGLLESAVAQRLFRKNRPEDGSVRSAGDGVPVQEAFLVLTGREATQTALDELTPNQTRELLSRVTSQPGPDICGTRSEPILRDRMQYDVEELHNGIANAHAYTVMGYDPTSDEVVLRNPWHRQVWVNAKDDASGIFSMPLPQFYSSFRWVAS